MVRFIMRIVWELLRWLLWDVDRQRRNDKAFPKSDDRKGSNRVQDITMGNVVAHVYLNRTATGKPYFKVAFKGVFKDGRLSNSFYVAQLKDLEDCSVRVRAWITDSQIAA